MVRTKATKLENQVYSNRVARSEFDRNWRSHITRSGYFVYVAKCDGASVTVLLTTGASKLITFVRGGKVWVGQGGTSHYSKPHVAKDL
ncbi:hypothetical protein [Paenibacillus sacheonensis]|uniref:Uncharacterized protein n=1 Tax=Paenibacillus sacheonensis TaxID=742054 RepID=A0A7X5BXM2_9BACL|nr:hypothetical protein [Paenibacillus sacheonensis]MBM7566689.1 hypothetical protein [Paenibacillus sacheonensis]NBC70668.1 hypothetical protein [Paenibacillus sacheonensis]